MAMVFILVSVAMACLVLKWGRTAKIYWQIGDIGYSGKGPDGQKWEYPNSGVIARSNPDGSDFEIFAAGLRNTHEFAFDQYANLISEDNDGDHAGEKESDWCMW